MSIKSNPDSQKTQNKIFKISRILLKSLLMEIQNPFYLSIFAFLTSFIVFFLYKTLEHQERDYSPKTHPILGCLIEFYRNRTRLLHWYTDLLTSSPTNTFVIRRIGARRSIVTTNPRNVEYLLKTNFDNYPKGSPFTDVLGDLLGTGIFNCDGQRWHTQRKVASHEFTTRSLRHVVVGTIKSEVTERLVPVLDDATKETNIVDMQDLLRRFAFDTICRISLGYDPKLLMKNLPASEFAAAFDAAAEICALRGVAPMACVWKMKRFLGIGSERVLKEKIGIIHKSITDLIVKRTTNNSDDSNNNDFLSRLIAGGNSVEVTRDMVISFVMAGRDTSSAALTWFFYLLSHHPDVESKVVSEVLELLKPPTATTDDEDDETAIFKSLKQMKFLEACLMETMRLYPPVVWDSKHASNSDVLPDGTFVGKGDRVTYFPYGMGRMEELWGENWSVFDPYRWLSSSSEELVKVSPYKFPVFQAGPRVCLGKEMAFVQMKYVAAAVLSKFELRRVPGDEPVFVPLLTAHMAGGLKMLVKERKL